MSRVHLSACLLFLVSTAAAVGQDFLEKPPPVQSKPVPSKPPVSSQPAMEAPSALTVTPITNVTGRPLLLRLHQKDRNLEGIANPRQRLMVNLTRGEVRIIAIDAATQTLVGELHATLHGPADLILCLNEGFRVELLLYGHVGPPPAPLAPPAVAEPFPPAPPPPPPVVDFAA